LSLLAWTNGVLAAVADALAAPVHGWPPLVSLLIVSAATAAVVLPVVARTSDQAGTAAVKRHIEAALLEIRLFNDDPPAVLRSVGDVLRLNGRYLRLSLVPLLWLALPFALVVSHLDPFYAYEGLTPGVPALVKLEQPPGTESVVADLVAPDAIRVETSAVRLMATHETLWRILPAAAGDYRLTIRAGGDSIQKTVHVGGGFARRSPRRVAPGFVDQFLYPSEPPLAGTAISAIDVGYPDGAIDVFGWRVHWLIVYIVASAVFARVLARPFGVTL
jgi:hypothetical protein